MIPLKEAAEKVLEFVPKDVELTVTVSPVKGLEPSFDLAETFAREGYAVVPHLSARLVRDRGHLSEIVARFSEMGTRDVFVVAGDADEAAGAYEGRHRSSATSARSVIRSSGSGSPGYPESHPLIDDATVRAAMAEKAPFADYIATQICFDPKVTVRWINEVWAGGIHLPVYVGLPGRRAASEAPACLDAHRDRRVGPLPAQARQLRHPLPPARRVQPRQADQGARAGARRIPAGKVAGFHIFTFNDLDDTEAWRQQKLAGRLIAS